MINSKVIFFCRKNDFYSNLMKDFLKKKFSRVKIIHSSINKKKINEKLVRGSFEYIFCFRSYFILNKKFLSKADYAINFHPGPPEYRGIGCVNFALFNNERKYGVTAHIMNEKIDNGKILDVKRFKIQKNMNIDQVLNKSYQIQVKQFKKIVLLLLKDMRNINVMIIKNKKEKWAKKITTRDDLNKLYSIKISKYFPYLQKLLRATYTKKFKPYFTLRGARYELQKK